MINSGGSQLIITSDILAQFRTDANGNVTYNGKNLLDSDTLTTLNASIGAAAVASVVNAALLIAIKTRRAVADAAATLAASDYLIAFTSLTATRALTLGAASGFAGQHFALKDESGQVGSNANPITIVGTVDGGVNPSAIIANYGKYKFYSNGTAWFTE